MNCNRLVMLNTYTFTFKQLGSMYHALPFLDTLYEALLQMIQVVDKVLKSTKC